MLKITAPGAADFYQGAEEWDFSFVDPDNRRAVDFKKISFGDNFLSPPLTEKRFSVVSRHLYTFLYHKKMIVHLKYIKDKEHDPLSLIQEFILTKEDGRIKLFLIYQALMARKRYKDIFSHGEYIPLEVAGKFNTHVVAFARRQEQRWAFIIAPRFFTGIINEDEFPLGEKIWADTKVILPQGAFGSCKDAISGQCMQIEGNVPVGKFLSCFCVSLLIKE